MQVKIVLPWILLIIIGFLTIWLFYKVIDQAVTIDDYGQEIKLTSEQRDVLANVINVAGIKASERNLREHLKEYDKYFFEKQKNVVVANQVEFFFKAGQLEKVSIENQ